jgi:hypothetical protein
MLCYIADLWIRVVLLIKFANNGFRELRVKIIPQCPLWFKETASPLKLLGGRISR